MTAEDPLLSVEDLRTHLDTEDGVVRAVDGLSFQVRAGETVCLVGESGSGKTITCDTVAGLVGPPAETSGTVRFDGEDLLSAPEKRLRSIRGDRLAYMFQHSQSALDPVYTVGDQIVEAVRMHRDVSDAAARERAVELLRTVGLSRPAERVDTYPHELSDGMSQRVAIAVALAADPDLLVADEPTSALDAMRQAQIIDLLTDLRRERSLSVLLVTHDFRVARALADRVVVLYGGTDVERGPTARVFERPGHPYTQDLLRSFRGHPPRGESRADVPTEGCRFHRECPHAVADCRGDRPDFHPVDGRAGDGDGEDHDHQAACVFHGPDRDAATVMDDASVDATDGGLDE